MGRSRGAGSGGKREDLGGLFFRSSWEANYARYQKFLVRHGEIKSWRYEPTEFEFPVKRGTRFYKPDFEIIENDGSVSYHEIKGWMDKQSATALKRMAKYYPNVKIVLVDKEAYAAIKKSVSKMIPHWETK